MPKPSRDEIGFNIEASSRSEARALPEEEPFRIALLGDFSGRSERGALADRKPLLIDRDNFDAVLEKMDVGIELPSGRIRIREIDDFHPDHIYETYPIFADLRGNRTDLADPTTFSDAARNITGEKPEPLPSASGGSILDQILGESGAAAKRAKKVDKIDAFVEKVTRPHLVQRADPRAAGLISQVDKRASELMRAVLHHSKFQAIEAAWRSVFLLIRELETGPELKVYIFDVSKQELAAHPEVVYQKLAQRTEAWGVLAGNYAFGSSDIPLLTVLGRIAKKFDAPFLGQADASLLDGGREWSAFRHSEEAKHVGLALPRVLLRLPYGKESSACDAFAFEEVTGKPQTKEMLFGNPALLCSMLLGQAFEQEAWGLRPGIVRDIAGLPVYTYTDDDESVAFPCAELALAQETAEALIENGFMPMAAIRNSDVVRALAFQSVSDPPAPLPGRWE